MLTKPKPFSILKAVLFLALASLALTACGTAALNNWPGLTASGDAIYTAQMQLKKIDAANGRQAWVYPDKADAKNLYYAPPAVTDGRVIAASYSNVVRMLDADSRNEIWAFTDVQDKGRFIAGPVVAGDLVLIPSTDHNLYALHLDSGKLAWKFTARNAIWGAVAVDEKLAYMPGLDHYLYAVNLTDGKLVWELDLGGPMLHAPVLGPDGLLYITSLNEEVIAVDTANRKVAWRQSVEGTIWNPPLLHEGRLYFGTDKASSGNKHIGKVYALDAKTGSTAWSEDTANPVIAAPVIFGGEIAFTTEGGDVFTKTPDGGNGWTRTITGKLTASPVVVGDHLIVGGTEMEHLLVTFDTQGKQDWTYDPPKN